MAINLFRNDPQMTALKVVLSKRSTRDAMVVSARSNLGLDYKDLAEDVAQDACVVALKRPDRVPLDDEQKRTLPFLCGIARLHATATTRKRTGERKYMQPLRRYVISTDGERTSVVPGDTHAAGDPVSVEDRVHGYDTWLYLFDAHPRFYWLFLAEIVGESHREIGLKYDRKEKSMSVEIMRARDTLDEQLAAYAELQEERARARKKAFRTGGGTGGMVLVVLLCWRVTQVPHFYENPNEMARVFIGGPDPALLSPLPPSHVDQVRVAAERDCHAELWESCIREVGEAIREDPRAGKLSPLQEVAMRALQKENPVNDLAPELNLRPLPEPPMMGAPPPDDTVYHQRHGTRGDRHRRHR